MVDRMFDWLEGIVVGRLFLGLGLLCV